MLQIATIIASLTSITNSYSTVDYGKINESKAQYSNSFLNSRICYSFDGSERFSLSNDLETYYLYDNLTNNNIKEWSSNSDIFSEVNDNESLLYSKTMDDFYTFDGKNIFCLDNIKLSDKEIETISNFELSAGSYSRVYSLPNNAKKIDNYDYFFKLKNNHSENKNNTSCSIVSFSTLLGYYDTFAHDNMINDVYDNTVVESLTSNSFKLFSQTAGVDKLNENNSFHDSLCDLCKSVTGLDPRTDSIYNNKIFGKLFDFYRYYLSKWINVSCDLEVVEGNPTDVLSKYNVTKIKEKIDSGRPVIAIGCGHATVAFAYDDNFIYVQGDKNFIQKTPWDTVDDYYETSLFPVYDFGMADIKVNSLHLHSNNYFNKTTSKYICSCGYVF